MVGGINFLALGEIFVVSLVAANALVFFFGLFVGGYTRFEEAQAQEGRSSVPQAALAVVSLLICVAIIVAGIYAMISK